MVIPANLSFVPRLLEDFRVLIFVDGFMRTGRNRDGPLRVVVGIIPVATAILYLSASVPFIRRITMLTVSNAVMDVCRRVRDVDLQPVVRVLS